MLLEILLSTILWTGFSQDAELKVSCDSVELDINIKSRATLIIVSFWLEDSSHKWPYKVPMATLPTGNISLQPTEFWVEEIRQRKNLIVVVNNNTYNFDLTGTKKQIHCE